MRSGDGANRMLIDESRLQKALAYLATTDEPAAELRAEVERAEFRAKAVRDTMFLHVEGKSATERASKAGASEEYSTAMEAYFLALKTSDAMRNKRTTEAIVIDCWRSLNAGRNKGQII